LELITLGNDMYFIIYETKCLIDGKVYIGAHQTENLDDGYLGSGIHLKRAIKLHGKENFHRKILSFHMTFKEMYAEEKQIVTPEFIKDKENYNLKPGGEGGWYSVNASGMNLGDGNVMKNPEIAKRCGVSGSKTKKGNKEFIKVAKENLKKAVEWHTGRKKPEMSKRLRKEWASGKYKHLAKLTSEKLSKKWRLTSPDGIEENVIGLEKWCKEKGLAYTTLTVSNGRKISKGKNKGWICERI